MIIPPLLFGSIRFLPQYLTHAFYLVIEQYKKSLHLLFNMWQEHALAFKVSASPHHCGSLAFPGRGFSIVIS
ncbi:hypothetical protein ACQP3F_32000, partial [Escherichia coli]